MNDLKLLNANETKFEWQEKPEMVTFDTNLNITFVTNHNYIYGIDSDGQVSKKSPSPLVVSIYFRFHRKIIGCV
jgi:hypothetical protein